jgi:hypothetical protein
MSYLAKRFKEMNKHAYLDMAEAVHRKTGKGKISVLIDMARCAVMYGSGYIDYELYEMYSLTPEQRDTYLTRGRSNDFVKRYNDPAYFHIFENKADFNLRFCAYLKRDWVSLQHGGEAEALAFMEKHPLFMAKPSHGGCGKGIEMIQAQTPQAARAAYIRLMNSGVEYVLEEIAQQHPRLSQLYPHSVNTIRALTLTIGGAPRIVSCIARIGNAGKFVDNFNSGGMTAPVDRDTGVVSSFGLDKKKRRYDAHPMTGERIPGFQFPDWGAAMEMVRRACLAVPEMGYIGWDVAFTPDGPILIEGNEFPGHDLYQLPEHTPLKIGMMPALEAIEQEARSQAREAGPELGEAAQQR